MAVLSAVLLQQAVQYVPTCTYHVGAAFYHTRIGNGLCHAADRALHTGDSIANLCRHFGGMTLATRVIEPLTGSNNLTPYFLPKQPVSTLRTVADETHRRALLMFPDQKDRIDAERDAFLQDFDVFCNQMLLRTYSLFSYCWLLPLWREAIYERNKLPPKEATKWIGYGTVEIPSKYADYEYPFVARSAVMIVGLMAYMDSLRHGTCNIELSSTFKGNRIDHSLCKWFYSAKVPGEEKYTYILNENTDHFIVSAFGLYYVIKIKTEEGTNREVADLYRELLVIYKDAQLKKGQKEAMNNPGFLASQGFDEWKKDYDQLRCDPTNAASLETVSTAGLCIALEGETTWSSRPEAALHCYQDRGNLGEMLTFTIRFNQHGDSVEEVDHGPCDATMMSPAIAFGARLEEGLMEQLPKPTASLEPLEGTVAPLEFNLGNLSTKTSTLRNTPINGDLQIDEALFNGWNLVADDKGNIKGGENPKDAGKLCKLAGIKPDCAIQIAMQLAFYRLMGKFPEVYQAASTRGLRSRTDTLRPRCHETQDFIRKMGTSQSTKDKTNALSVAAAKLQGDQTVATLGGGWERTMFGHAVLSTWRETPNALVDIYRSTNTFELSTSQLPQGRINKKTREVDPDGCGGCFLPWKDTGFGVFYRPDTVDNFEFFISYRLSDPSSKTEEADQEAVRAFNSKAPQFKEAVVNALKDMTELLQFKIAQDHNEDVD